MVKKCGGCFDGFNIFAMEEEGLFADHPTEVKALIDLLRQDKTAALQFIKALKSETEISVNNILLTKNDLEQIYVALAPWYQAAAAWIYSH